MKYSSDIKETKEFGFARLIVYNLVLSIFISLALGVLMVYALGLRLDVVMSYSMAPTFYKHDIVIVKPCDDYEVGDIIEFRTGAKNPVCHRITDKITDGSTIVYATKGDNVSQEDKATVAADKINGKVIMIIENGEYIYEFIKSNYFLLIDIILGVWVLNSTLTGEIEMRKHNIAKSE